MAATKVLLFGATASGGQPIKITQTGTVGNTIHTTGSSASVIDDIVLQAYNNDTVDQTVTLEWGGTTSPDNLLTFTIPTKQMKVISPGIPLSGTGSAGRSVTAFASSANKILITGHVIRY